MFAVATGKVKVDSFFGLGRSKERVLYCEPINAGDYHLVHAFLGLDLRVSPDDLVSLPVSSIKRVGVGTNKPGKIIFGGSVLALPTLRDGNNVLAVIPNIGHTALEIGPDSDGLTFSLIRYKGLVDAPIAAGERVVHKLIRSMATIS